jgi:hypothetical protein
LTELRFRAVRAKYSSATTAPGKPALRFKPRVLGISLLLMGIVASSIAVLPTLSVQGQLVGLVCLSPSSSGSCPAPPVTVTAPVGTQLMIGVLIQSSDSISGFDITMKANHTALVPAGISMTGSLLFGGTIIDECFGGVVKVGPRCSTTDGVDTLHLAAVGPSGFLTRSPTSGLLFTAVYNVTGTATTAINYQTGCSNSSVTGTTTCVVFSNGSIVGPAETVQTATYAVTPVPTFSIATGFGEITMGKGSSANLTLTLASLNGFAGNVALSTISNSTARHPPTFSTSPSSVTLVAGGSGTAFLLVTTRSNVDKITYFVTIAASSGSISESVLIQIFVIP